MFKIIVNRQTLSLWLGVESFYPHFLQWLSGNTQEFFKCNNKPNNTTFRNKDASEIVNIA